MLRVKRIWIRFKGKYHPSPVHSEPNVLDYYERKGIILQKCTCNCELMKRYDISYKKGIPDFCYEHKGKIIFVEAKSETGGLSYHQAKWIADHFQYDTHIIYVKGVGGHRDSIRAQREFMAESEYRNT